MAVSNITKNLSAGSFARVSSMVFKLVQVPLFLGFLSADDYGRWLVLSSLPSWLAYANQGFGTVAANEIPIAVAAGDLTGARRHYSTTFAFMIVFSALGILLTLLVLPLVSWHSFLETSPSRDGEVSMALLWLITAMLLSFLGELFYGRYRAGQQAHVYILISSFQGWIELIALFVVFQFTSRFDYLALAVLGSALVYLLINAVLSQRAFPKIGFSLQDVGWADFKSLFRKGFAFQAFPLGNALLFQGNLLIVQFVIGPSAVALFGTVRTMVRVLNQTLELISKSIWPELSFLFGKGDIPAIRNLHRFGMGLSVALALCGTVGVAILGPYVYDLWVGDSMDLPWWLLLLFLLPIPFNALWLTSSTVMMASNNHLGLARRYLIATVMSTVACLVLTWLFGVGGAAVSSIIMDLILIPYVIRQAVDLTQDSLPEFLAGSWNELGVTVRKVLSRLKPVQAT